MSSHEAIGTGDVENDDSFLERCGCAVTVANDVPAIRKFAASTTRGEAGQGVVEIVDELIADDLSRIQRRRRTNAP